MIAKDLDSLSKIFKPNTPVYISSYNPKTGKTELFFVNWCCNIEHQKQINQIWLSRGLLISTKK